MKIQFCGAAQTVTGSAHLITLDNGYKILLDCGLYQGYDADYKTFNNSFLFKPSEIDCLILSHAHIDHSGRIPQLVKEGFDGKIYSTHATRSLCAIMLVDSAKIQERDAAYFNKKQLKKSKSKRKPLQEPLYDGEDVRETMTHFVGLSYDKRFFITRDIEVEFRDAGHILGSASVTLYIHEHGETKILGFTGDIGRPNRPILRDPAPMPEVDYLICESTYGDKEHEQAPAEEEHFLKIIKETCVENKGKLVIPAFSVGRTQEIVYMLDRMETAKKLPKIPVFVDSPLAINATEIFGIHPECFDDNLNEYMLIDDNPFGFNSLSYVKKVEGSKAINDIQGPCIIISAAGMINAGRIRHHVYNTIQDAKNTLLIVGYCSPETPGGQLRNGATTLKMFGEELIVRANIEIMDSFSAHADRTEMVDFLQNQKNSVQKLFLVHGELEPQKAFKDYLKENNIKTNVYIPTLGQVYNL